MMLLSFNPHAIHFVVHKRSNLHHSLLPPLWPTTTHYRVKKKKNSILASLQARVQGKALSTWHVSQREAADEFGHWEWNTHWVSQYLVSEFSFSFKCVPKYCFTLLSLRILGFVFTQWSVDKVPVERKLLRCGNSKTVQVSVDRGRHMVKDGFFFFKLGHHFGISAVFRENNDMFWYNWINHTIEKIIK